MPPFASEIKNRHIEKEKPKERISINVNLTKGYFKRKSLNEHEIEYLLKLGYKEFSYKSICSRRKENYLLRPRFNETLNHMIVIYDIAEYLNKKKVENAIFTTRMPDVVVFGKNKDFALEIETGSVLTNMKKFREKMKLLENNYPDAFYFIVTDRNLIKKYRKYGKVIDPRYIKGQLDKIIKLSRK